MKKIYLLLAAVAMITVAACQKPETTPVNNGQGNYDPSKDPNKPSGVDDTTIPTDEYLIQTGKALLDAADVENWKAEAEFVHKVAKALKEKKWEDETLKNWAYALSESWQQEPRKEGNRTIYENIIRLSDAKGHFEEQADGSFKFTQANDLQITVLVEGERVTATFSCTDSTVPILFSGNTGISFDPETGQEYRVEHNNLLYVPTTAVLKIIRGDNSEFASIVLNASAVVKDPKHIDPYSDSANIDMVVKVGAYSILVNELAYSPTGAKVHVKFLKNNANLVSYDIDANYTLNKDTTGPVPVESGAANAVIDIMGRVQVKANVPNWETTMNAIIAAEGAQTEAECRAKLDEFEKSCSVGLYFNGASTARALLGVEITQGGRSFNPVLRFPDGTSMGVESYFTEERFSPLIEYGQKWVKSIDSYISELFRDI